MYTCGPGGTGESSYIRIMEDVYDYEDEIEDGDSKEEALETLCNKIENHCLNEPALRQARMSIIRERGSSLDNIDWEEIAMAFIDR